MRILTLVAAFALSSSAQAKLEIRDVQASHGQLGPERKSNEYVQGDQVYFRFKMTGVRTDEDGRTRAEMRIVVTDAKGEKLIDNEFPFQQIIGLGGGEFPAAASFYLNREFAPGQYELSVKFTDLIANETVSFSRTVVCVPVTFALNQIRFYHDSEGRAPACVGGTIGQRLVVKMLAVGFDRSKDEIDIEMELQVINSQGKPVIPKPLRWEFHNEKPAEVKRLDEISLTGSLALNREGEFTLRVIVTDRVTKKKVSFEAPLRVVPL
jgi:hypothetical protein